MTRKSLKKLSPDIHTVPSTATIINTNVLTSLPIGHLIILLTILLTSLLTSLPISLLLSLGESNIPILLLPITTVVTTLQGQDTITNPRMEVSMEVEQTANDLVLVKIGPPPTRLPSILLLLLLLTGMMADLTMTRTTGDRVPGGGTITVGSPNLTTAETERLIVTGAEGTEIEASKYEGATVIGVGSEYFLKYETYNISIVVIGR